jgi:hypothetical protein
MMASVIHWIKTFFSTSPDASFGRLATFISLVFCLGWDSATMVFVFLHWKDLHPVIADLWAPAATLLGQFTACATFYTITKAKDAISPDNGQQK